MSESVEWQVLVALATLAVGAIVIVVRSYLMSKGSNVAARQDGEAIARGPLRAERLSDASEQLAEATQRLFDATLAIRPPQHNPNLREVATEQCDAFRRLVDAKRPFLTDSIVGAAEAFHRVCGLEQTQILHTDSAQEPEHYWARRMEALERMKDARVAVWEAISKDTR